MTSFADRRRMMVDTQVRPADVTKFPIIDALLATPREHYLSTDLRESAYVGDNLTIAPGRVLLDPRTLAKMLDALAIGPDALVLDVGCAWGYSTALIARQAQMVIGVEEIAEMAAEAPDLLSEDGIGNAAIVAAPLAEGAPQHAPFDVILLQGGVEDVPAALLDQLKEGGRIAALFQIGNLGEVRLGVKRAGAVSWRFGFNASAPVLPGFTTARSFAL